MERVKIDNIELVFETEPKRAAVESILKNYLDKGSGKSAESIEALFRESIEQHKKDPRKFGVRFRELLQSGPETNIELNLRTGISINVVLDRLVYPSQKQSDPAIPGWPPQKYFPDGFSFLSHNRDTTRAHTDPSGEKIRIDKLALLNALPQAEFVNFVKKLVTLINALPKDANGKTMINSEKAFKEIYQHMSDFIQFTYEPKPGARKVKPLVTQSVRLDEFVNSPTEAVCRHKELVAQVLLQMLGMPGEILECHMYMRDDLRGDHLATMIKLSKSTYIVDFTNPDHDAKKTVFMEKIKDTSNPDQGINEVLWNGHRNVGPKGGMDVTYLTKVKQTQVYYRIIHGDG